eukprot:tig00021254_g19711.t1
MTGDSKRAIAIGEHLEREAFKGLELERALEKMAPAPIASLPDELLVKILRVAAKERFKAEIDAAGGPLALFESAAWDVKVERWLEGCPGGVEAFLAEHTPRLTGLREVTVDGDCKHGARFLAALPCWPSLLSLRLLSLPPAATSELRACLDALAAVPAAKRSLSLLMVDVNINAKNEDSKEASSLVWAIVRRCASSLRSLKLHGIAVEGRWEDLLPSPGLRDFRLLYPPRPVALGGLERSGAAATLETLDIDAGDPLSGPGGPDAARALAALPALSSLKIGVDVDESLCSLLLPPPPAGSFPALRSLALSGRFTRSDWWAAVLASPVGARLKMCLDCWAALLASPTGARLKSLSLTDVRVAGRVLEAIGASGLPPALRALRLTDCYFGARDAPRLAGLLAACPALQELGVCQCPGLNEFLAGGGDAGAAGPRLRRVLAARGVDVRVV